MARRQGGYTLVELVVVILIFGIVMAVISVSFKRIMSGSAQVMKSAETEIGGLIGLELLRGDLEFAGFGLPWSIGSASYGGESKSHLVDDIPETDAANFNDSSLDGAPRAFVLLNNKGYHGSDYLVLKGTALGLNNTARAWSYLNYSGGTGVLKPSKSDVELVPGNCDQVIVLSSGMRGGTAFRDLVHEGSTIYLTLHKPYSGTFMPKSNQDTYLVYGIAQAGKVVSFPFNRADYYLGPPSDTKRSSLYCAPGTGTLYRGEVSQTSGTLVPSPVLDCVGDFQVVFMLDTSNDGTPVAQDLDAYAKGVKSSGEDVAQAIREQVKEVRVYILVQDGKIDPGFSYPVSDPEKAIMVGDRAWKQSDLADTFCKDNCPNNDLWRHYHWKVYTIVVQPKNLQ